MNIALWIIAAWLTFWSVAAIWFVIKLDRACRFDNPGDDDV